MIFRNVKQLFCSVVLGITLVSGVFCAQSASGANRRTALRCLSLAENYILEQNWNGAVSQCLLGINYDENISDLWYVLAASSSKSGKTKADVLPLVKKALDTGNWVNYNKDSARLLYADILCDTGHYKDVLSVLDEKPVIYSADAEYVRIKALYRINTPESISTARNKIDGARRIYPDDTRFPLFFFKNERPGDPDKDVSRIADYFIRQVTQYVEAAPDKDAELEIYAARFASGESRTRLLKSFSSRDLRHPLYSIVALEDNLMSEEEAFDYFTVFADDSIRDEIIYELLALISDSKVIQKVKEYFTAWSGVLLYDSDADGIENTYVKYSRGRPQTVFYDENQDGIMEWNMVCDFGVPVAGTLTKESCSVEWKDYPFVSSVTLRDYTPSGDMKFYMPGETLSWSPVTMSFENPVTQLTGFQFFVPLVKNLEVSTPEVSPESLLATASKLSITSEREKNVSIEFSILEKNVLYADYFKNGVRFARTHFENNLPVMRVVDSDLDGTFETTEVYVQEMKLPEESPVAEESERNIENAYADEAVHTFEEEEAILQNIYGRSMGKGLFYLQMVQVDTDKDSVPDFTEEYFKGGIKVSSWDTDGDGEFNVRSIINSKEKTEHSIFYLVPQKKTIALTSSKGLPVSVFYEDEEIEMKRDENYDFWWLGNMDPEKDLSYYSDMARKSLVELSAVKQGECILIEEDDEVYNVIRISGLSYGLIIKKAKVSDEEK